MRNNTNASKLNTFANKRLDRAVREAHGTVKSFIGEGSAYGGLSREMHQLLDAIALQF